MPSLPTFWRWVRIAGGTTVATTIMSVGSLASNVLVFRLLPPAAAGQFALLVALSQTLSMLASLGQQGLIRRLYSLHPLGHYDWRRDLWGTLLLVTPVAAFGSYVVHRIYRLGPSWGGFVFMATLSLVTLMVISHMLASQRHYMWSNALLRLPYNLLLIALIPIAMLSESDRLAYIIFGQMVMLVIAVALGLLLLHRLVPSGDAYLPLSQRRNGLVFVTSTVAYQLPEEGLLSIAGALVPPAHLGAVAALVLFLRLFSMSYDILSHILITELARREQIRYRQMLIALLVLTAGLSIGAWVLIPVVSSLLYSGRFDAYHYLVPWLVLGAALQLAEVLPRSHILARVSDAVLNRYVAIHALIALLGAGLTFGLIVWQGVLGLAIGSAILYLVRNIASYYFSTTSRSRSLKNSAAVVR